MADIFYEIGSRLGVGSYKGNIWELVREVLECEPLSVTVN